MNNFGNRLRSARQIKRLSLRNLEEITGIHYSIISQYENHHYLPQVDHLVKLSNSLSANIHWLVTGEGLRELPGATQQESSVAELAACQKKRDKLQKQINRLKDQHYRDLNYINELQRELLHYKKSQ